MFVTHYIGFFLQQLLLLLLLLTNNGNNQVNCDPVHIWSTKSEQPITSSTLQWISISNGKNSHNLFKNAVVAAYQAINRNGNDADVEDPEILTDDNQNSENHREIDQFDPVYICRAKVTSIWVTGQLRPANNVCIVSLYRQVQEYNEYEILINIDNSARLSWLQKNKFINLPHGAVTSGENVLRTFVARRSTETHNHSGSLTHFIGTFNPSENLGVYNLVDQNNNELIYEDGEILVETEPISYEFKSLKFKRVSTKRFPRQKLLLAETILKNTEKGLQKVESVMDYEYKYFISWGKGHGILTGLPFIVNLPNGSQTSTDYWGLAKPLNKIETVPVQRYLDEGTGVNITLMGNFTEMEIPYTATVVANYKDNEKREFIIEDTKREHKVIDLVFNYSPIYFLNNNSYVPTTTTTSSTSTTTTSTSTTTSTTSTTTTTIRTIPNNTYTPSNNHPEVILSNNHDNSMAADDSHQQSTILQDLQREASSLEKKKIDNTGDTGGDVATAGAGAGGSSISGVIYKSPFFWLYFYILIIFIRVT